MKAFILILLTGFVSLPAARAQLRERPPLPAAELPAREAVVRAALERAIERRAVGSVRRAMDRLYLLYAHPNPDHPSGIHLLLPETLAVIDRLLTHENVEIQRAAALFLANARAERQPEVIPRLKRLIYSHDPKVREYVSYSLQHVPLSLDEIERLTRFRAQLSDVEWSDRQTRYVLQNVIGLALRESPLSFLYGNHILVGDQLKSLGDSLLWVETTLEERSLSERQAVYDYLRSSTRYGDFHDLAFWLEADPRLFSLRARRCNAVWSP